jgi:hypothetical protein
MTIQHFRSPEDPLVAWPNLVIPLLMFPLDPALPDVPLLPALPLDPALPVFHQVTKQRSEIRWHLLNLMVTS